MHQIALEPQPESSYSLIPLTQGQFAIVDANDYEWLMQWKWYAKLYQGKFYACRTQHRPKKTIRMHRLIAGDPKGLFVDHRDTNTLNNRRNNLRPATHAQNNWNTATTPGASGFKGVQREDKKWLARIATAEGKTVRLGRFQTAEEARAAYVKAARERYGEFARCWLMAAAGRS